MSEKNVLVIANYAKQVNAMNVKTVTVIVKTVNVHVIAKIYLKRLGS